MQQVGSRKFLFSLIFGFIITTLAGVMNFLQIKIDDNMVKISVMIFMGYLGANVFAKLFNEPIPENAGVFTTNRKFIFSIFFGIYMMIVVAVMKFFHKPIQDNLTTLYTSVYLGYLFGNVADKFANQFALIAKMFNKTKEKNKPVESGMLNEEKKKE